MKRFGIILVMSTFVVAGFTQMILSKQKSAITPLEIEEEYKFPKKVKAVIDQKCYGCHSVDGKSNDAKEALRWDLMHEYDKSKLVAIMDEIIEVIEEEEMPPKKMVEKKPEMKLTEKEAKTLLSWAEKEAEKLFK